MLGLFSSLAARAGETCTLSTALEVRDADGDAKPKASAPRKAGPRALAAGARVEVVAREGNGATLLVDGALVRVDTERLDIACPRAPSLTATSTSTSATPTTATRAPSERVRLVVLGLQAPADFDVDVRQALEETIAYEVTRYSKADVVSPGDVRSLLDVQALAQALSCEDAACSASAGDLLAAQHLVSGGVRSVAGKQVLSLQLYETANRRFVQRVNQEVGAGTEPLLGAARSAVAALFGVVGRISVWNQPADGEVLIDGRPVGTTPVDDVLVSRPGLHVVSIVGPGLTRWSQQVNVGAGTVVAVRARNERLADLEAAQQVWRGLGAGLLGAGVVAGGFAGVVGVGAVNSDRRIDALDLRATSQSELDTITSESVAWAGGAVALGVVAVGALGGGVWALLANPATASLDADEAATRAQ